MGFGRRMGASPMQLDAPVFGVVTAQTCYHSSPDCPLFKSGRRPEVSALGKLIKYANSDEAAAAGHLRPCECCLGHVAVKLEGDTYMRLTVEQLDTLRIVKKLSSVEGTALKLKDIAAARRCHISTCYVLVRILQKKRLVRKEYAPGHRKARSGTITPTPLADRVLAEMANY